MHYRSVSGSRDEKFRRLRDIRLDDDGWKDTHLAGHRPFTPVTQSGWGEFPALDDLFPWGSPAVKANRSWVSSPSKETLRRRWVTLVREPDPEIKSELFKETPDRKLGERREPLPGRTAHPGPIGEETRSRPETVRIALRSFDRQWLIADNRVLDRPRPDLWAATHNGQIFLNHQSSHAIDSGPAVVATHLLPDTHHFNGRGGRVMPILHPDGSPNTPAGLLPYLTRALGGEPVTVSDLAAYTAAVTGHSAFTERFAEDLLTPGVRLPLTRDAELWNRATALGAEILWASTYSERFADTRAGRPVGDVGFPSGDERQVRYLTHIGGTVPNAMSYDPETETLHVGEGTFAPVPEAVWAYHVGGMRILNKWFGYRKAKPTSKKTSPLDDIHVESWPPEWTTELIELLCVLRRLTDLAHAQSALLTEILAGEVITGAELAAEGVTLASVSARKPRHRPVGGLFTEGNVV
ncbi:DNA methyltransferase [Streptomyces sp. NBC_00727]|uniref:type ISP restriction/modification enzyme n=1 Tax=Streptomyces sp. NBC_00727 TaxID=2903675 RepID=UPI00386F515D